MDRRMYRSNMGNAGKNMNPCRQEESICADSGRGHMHEEPHHMHEEPCGHHMHEEPCGHRMHDECGEHEKHHEDFDRFPLAMCYVPWQCFGNLYENEFVALENGTLFKELDLKWYGRSCK